MSDDIKRVGFTAMKDGTAADYDLLVRRHYENARDLPDTLLNAIASLEGAETGYQVDRKRHSLQSASRAWRDGADDDWVIAALFHDIGDVFAPFNHDEYAASVLKPFLREQCSWTVGHHGAFQMVYYGHLIGADKDKREVYRDSPYFDDCAEFCEIWDQNSFDPDYPDLPLEHFEPIVRQVFARVPHDPGVLRPGTRIPLTDAETARARK